MNIVTVLPIKKAVGIDSLTYFSSECPEIGSIVEIPIRKKKAAALVTDVQDVKKNKMALKNSGFTLRKMESVIAKPFLPAWFMEVASRAGNYYATSTGAIIFSLLHKLIIELGLPNVSVDLWRPITVVCPTVEIAEAKYAKHNEKGTAVLFTSNISKRDYKKNLKLIEEGNVDTLIITGPFIALIPRATPKIIMEHESSRWYKGRQRPFIDMRTVASMLAKQLNVSVDSRDILKEKNIRPNKITILSKKKNKDAKEKKVFSIFDKHTEDKIDKALEKKQKVFVFALRNGHSPIVLCGHCGKTVLCEKCESPVVLYKGKESENYFLCHHCGTKRSALEKCKACDSWKLESLGIGIEKIKEEIANKWPGFIEVGTEKSLETLGEYSLCIIPSIDSLLSLPDFRVDEKIFITFLTLNQHTDGEIIIGTKYEELPLLEYIRNIDVKGFLKDQEIKKKKFGYPPFKTLIKITLRGKKEKITEQSEHLTTILKKYQPTLFPAFIKSVNHEFILHMLIKIDSAFWPDPELSAILRSLPPWIEININPESLL